MRARYRAVVFDLFGTLLRFRVRPDPAFTWLRDAFEASTAAADFDAFRAALVAVSKEIAAERAPEHREVASRERFARALARVGLGGAAAEALSATHMGYLAAATELPAGHGDLVRELSARYRLGLVSNFDHPPTAQAVLARHGIHRCFAATLISADVGRRKPHPEIFAEALTRLGVAPPEALFVGDTHAEDVVGARGAGLDVAWLAPADAPDPEPRPTIRITRLDELTAWL
ncbi:MAG: HAD family hydrolase [Candidatus Binatia bacterium]